MADIDGLQEMTYIENGVEITLYTTGKRDARDKMIIETALIIVPCATQLHDTELYFIYDNAVEHHNVISPLSKSDKRNLDGNLIIQLF